MTTYYTCTRCGRSRPASQLVTDNVKGPRCKRPCRDKLAIVRALGNFESAAGDPGDSIQPQ